MQDFFGSVGTAVPIAPRAGQWCLITLNDREASARLIAAGAHVSTDGKLVAIFRNQETTPTLTTVKSDGAKSDEGGELLPARYVFVDTDGNNVPVPVKKEHGHAEIVNACVYDLSPKIASVEPVSKLNQMPPGRVIHPLWAEALHGKTLPESVRQQQHGITVKDALSKLAG
jgi:hypothetical protein